MAVPVTPLAPDDTARLPRSRRPLRARFSTGHVVMVVAGLLGALLTLQVLRGADDRVEVTVLRRDVPAGSRVRPTDLTSTRVRVDDDVVARLVRTDEQAEVTGAVATHLLRRGDLLSRHDISRNAGPEGKRAMSIPIEPSRAAGGDIAIGDHVDVIATTERGSEYIVADAEVLKTGGGSGNGVLRTDSSDYFVELAVDAEEAMAIASGLQGGSLDVVLASGAEPLRSTQVERVATSAPEDRSSTSARSSAPQTTTGSGSSRVEAGSR